MAITFDNTETSGKVLVLETGGARDMVFAKPSNVIDGDDMLLAIAVDGAVSSTVTWTAAAGWTQIVDHNDTGTSGRPIIGVWKKTASSEGSDYTFSYAAATGTLNNGIGFIIRLSGAHAVTFEDVADAVNEQTTANPVAPSVTTVTDAAMLLAIATVNDGRNLTGADTGYPTGFTGIYARSASVSSSSPTMAAAFKEQATAGASGTATFTSLLTTSSGQNTRSIMLAIRPAAVSAAEPSITNFGDEVHYHGETGITITGTNFNAAQGDGFVIVSPTNDPDDVNAVTQTVTAWSDTSITITSDLDTFEFDTDLYLFVQNSDEGVNAAGFAFQRAARIYFRDTDVQDLASAGQTNLTDINWKMWSDATLSTVVDSGTGETVDASSDIEIGPITQGSLDPNSTMNVWLALTIDGASGSELAFLGKVALVAE